MQLTKKAFFGFAFAIVDKLRKETVRFVNNKMTVI
jgi:hypothetical protein